MANSSSRYVNCRLVVQVDYNNMITDPDSLASAMDSLLETALSTCGTLDEYGNPEIGEFFVLPEVDESLYWLATKLGISTASKSTSCLAAAVAAHYLELNECLDSLLSRTGVYNVLHDDADYTKLVELNARRKREEARVQRKKLDG